MNIKVLSSVVALAIGGAAYGSVAQAATESSEVTIEKSTTVQPSQPSTTVREESSTTTTKRGLFGRKKSETTSSTKTYDRDPVTNAEVTSRTTTTETQRNY